MRNVRKKVNCKGGSVLKIFKKTETSKDKEKGRKSGKIV